MSLGADFTNVDALIEARIRFHLYETKLPQHRVGFRHRGEAINEVAVLAISAHLQAFFEVTFLECSQKSEQRRFSQKEEKKLRQGIEKWGNPNTHNVSALFERLGLHDVMVGFRTLRKPAKQVCCELDRLNGARNKLAHGKPPRFKGKPVKIDLSQVRKWREEMSEASGKFRFHVLHSMNLPSYIEASRPPEQ